MMAPRLWGSSTPSAERSSDLAFGFVGLREGGFRSVAGGRGGDGYYTLVVAGTGQAIELAAVLEAHRDVLRAGELNNFFDAGVLAALGDEDAIGRRCWLRGLRGWRECR
jgi:hypothetical protein